MDENEATTPSWFGVRVRIRSNMPRLRKRFWRITERGATRVYASEAAFAPFSNSAIKMNAPKLLNLNCCK
jgi:hypothetical protein